MDWEPAYVSNGGLWIWLMKNHMANIKGLAETGQCGEIGEYVHRMNAFMQALEYKYATGNAVTLATFGGSLIGDFGKNMQALASDAKEMAGKRFGTDISGKAFGARA
ncbi:MAG: hypothetical protein HFH36_05630 [Lachnospiraceae bacterium]|nr:hypothetical protein [Lachnospiraceae bacterium]